MSQIRYSLQFAQNCMVISSPYPNKMKGWLARKIMACGKGSGKAMIGNQLTKDNSNNLSKSWLVLSKRLQVKTNQNR